MRTERMRFQAASCRQPPARAKRALAGRGGGAPRCALGVGPQRATKKSGQSDRATPLLRLASDMRFPRHLALAAVTCLLTGATACLKSATDNPAPATDHHAHA